jgi:hypothetical protein
MEAVTSPERSRGSWRSPAVAGGLAALSVLLFCWPFVCSPALGFRETFIHLFATWACLILLLWRTSRGLAAGPAQGGAAADD